MSRLIKAHIPCPYCGSSDAGSEYDDGFYCFSCGTFKPNNGEAKEVSRIEREVRFLELGFTDIRSRNLSKDVCQSYEYGISRYNGEPVQVANYYHKGELKAQHIRTKDKQFFWLGATGHLELFGQHLHKSEPYLVITEGEVDALTVAQLKLKDFLVVSVPNGAVSAKKYIVQNLDFVESFQRVYLWFDNDEPGLKALHDVVQILTPGKAYVIRSRFKDANETFLEAGVNAVLDALKQATLYRPDHLMTAEELGLEKLLTTPKFENFKVGFKGINNFLKGLRKHELVMIGAGTGVGKSTFMRHLAWDLMTLHDDLKIAYIALEESVEKTVLGFIAMDNGVSLGDLYLDRSIIPEEKFKESYAKFKNKLILYDHFGSTDPLNMLNKIKYLAKANEVDFVFLDHLSIIVSGLEITDERKAIDVFLTKLRSLIEETSVGVVMVSHLNSASNTNHEEGARVHMKDFRGSRSIGQLSDAVIALERNIQHSDMDKRRETKVRVLKNRLFGENTGLAAVMEYHGGKLIETEVFEAGDVFEEQEGEDVEDF